MTVKLDIVTAARIAFSGEVESIVAPGIEGEMGILPHHAPLMTTLNAGELVVRSSGEEYSMAISGGFLEVQPDRVIILADAAERVEEIDIARAEEAKRRAQEVLEHPVSPDEAARAEAALRRALARIGVVEKRKRRRTA